MVEELTRYERFVMTVGEKVTAPAGKACGRILGRVVYKGECSMWALPAMNFVRGIDAGIDRHYEERMGQR